MRTIFASYATPEFAKLQQRLCNSAEAVGFDVTQRWTRSDIDGTDFARDYRMILEHPRGAGYWLWKPWLIRQAVERLAPDEVLVYSDSGRSSYYVLRHFPRRLIQCAKQSRAGFLLGPSLPQHGPLRLWTKRDCLTLMGADNNEFLNHPQIQATWSIWTNTSAAKSFLDLWLNWCMDRRCLTDDPNELGYPNYPDFRDHRHDQSILTILAHQLRADYIDSSEYIVTKLLLLRRRSSISHMFLKRIDDAELALRKMGLVALIMSIYDLKINPSTSR